MALATLGLVVRGQTSVSDPEAVHRSRIELDPETRSIRNGQHPVRVEEGLSVDS